MAEDDHVVIEEVGPGSFAIRKESRKTYDFPVDPLEEAARRAHKDSLYETNAVINADCVHRPDVINHPPHYTSAVETLDAIEAWDLNYRLGNVVKYVSRAGKKDPTKRLEDLMKARFYLDREIAMSGGDR